MSPDHSNPVKMTVHFPTLIMCLWLNSLPLKLGKSSFADLPGTAAFVSQPLVSGLGLGLSCELDSKSNSAPSEVRKSDPFSVLPSDQFLGGPPVFLLRPLIFNVLVPCVCPPNLSSLPSVFLKHSGKQILIQ